TFTLTYRGETTADIAWNATANDIKDALELLSTVNTDDITVSASIDDGVTFTFANTLGDVGLIMINSSLTDGVEDVTASIAETTPGIDGWLSRSTNSISDVVAGVTLNLHDVTETDNPIEITVSRNRQTISSKISNMAIAYNALTSFLAEKTEYNDETEEMGILSSNLGVSFIKSLMRSSFFGLAPGFKGLTVDHHGVMELDQDELDDALDEDFMDVIYLLGAAGIGDSDSDTIEFYGCSEEHTTAGTYDVDIHVGDSEMVTSALIKLSSESVWRNATINTAGNLITGDSTFDDNGDPVYPENSLKLSVDVSVEGDFTATVYVKQGVVGALEDVLENVLEAEGSLDVGLELVESNILQAETRIKNEQSRLEDAGERLILKYARLEKTLTALQQQMSTVSMLVQATFGNTGT
ncbi:MAG: flagellar filament capping protein FliD, partial [Planctomycetota bacterium]